MHRSRKIQKKSQSIKAGPKNKSKGIKLANKAVKMAKIDVLNLFKNVEETMKLKKKTEDTPQ